MFKKLLSILTLLVALCMGTTAKASGTYTDGEGITWITVTTAQEFSDAITGNTNSDKVCSANIRLMNDIKLQPLQAGALGSDNYLFDVTFSGRITSDAADGYYALTDTQHTLFRKLKGATIKQIFIAQSSFDGRDTSSGMLADDCYNSTLENIYFYEITAEGSSGGYDCDRMGIAVGQAEGSRFKDLFFINCELTTDGEAAGFACGSATSCTFSYCHTSTGCSLWADGNSATPILPGVDSNAFAGGICGYGEDCSLTGCINLGIVSSDDDRIGGIIGHGKNTTVTDCRNAGLVKHCTKVGFGRESRIYAANIVRYVAFGSAIATAASGIAYNQLFIRSGIPEAQANYDQKVSELLENGEGWHTPELESAKDWAGILLNGAVKAAVGTTIAGFSYVFFAVATSVTTLTAVSFDIYEMLSKPDEMGGIVGKAEAGSKILRCVNYGAVVCADVECGGIVGYLDKSSVESCYNQNFVRGEGKTGGIVGYSNNGIVKNCLNIGRVTNFNGSGYFGITGVEDNVTSGNTAGNYYLYDERKDHGTAWSFTEEDLASGWVAKQMNDNLGENPIWRQKVAADGGDFYPNMDEASGRPLVTSVASEGGYSVVQKVYTGSQFIQAATNPNAKIVLEDDIDLSGLGFLLSDYYNPFKGTIDGQGHTIANFAYESSRFDYRNTGDGHRTEAPHHIALFPYTSGATIKNLVIDNFHITQRTGESKFLGIGAGALKEGLLVGESSSSTFENIRVRNSDILLNSDKDYKWIVGGLVATATGTNDDLTYITDCTIESSCRFESYVGAATDLNSNLGGFAGTASHTLFTRCHNAGELWGEDDYAGGICGYAAGCGFWNCLNSGKITCQRNVGGIVGYAGSSEIKESVNTGTICGDEGDSDNDHIAGIVGTLENSISRVEYCLSFGDLKSIDDDDTNGAIIGEWKSSNNANYINNLYYYSHKGQNRNNLSDFGYTKEDLYSGKVAYNATNADGKKYLYQSLDNDPFCTNLPVPIPAAGKVFMNSLCSVDASAQSLFVYSNIMHNTNTHNSQGTDKWGFCTVCGFRWQVEVPATIEIASAADLMTLSKGVSMGVNYAHTTITLANDIDFKDINDYVPIGTSMEHPFRGTFNGNGHRIKNLHIERISGATGVGLFGVVTGESEISDLVMDSTCTINGGSSLGVGGIVGCINTSTADTKAYLTFDHCGNEATVIGGENTGGLIGAAYDELNVGGTVNGTHLELHDCYNTGTVSGTKVSGALAGYAHFWIKAYRCYNIGNVYGYVANHPLVHFNPNAETHLFNQIYQWDQLAEDEHATKTTLNEFMFGSIAHSWGLLGWGQNIGTDTYPVLSSTKKVCHERSMANSWGTAYLPFAVKSDANVQLYKVLSSEIDNSTADGTMTLEPVESIEANVPFFFKKLNSAATSVCLVEDRTKSFIINETATVDTQAPGWSMTGAYYNLSDVTGVYFVAQDKLWYAEEPIEVPGLRTILIYNNSTNNNSTNDVKSLRILVDEDGETTQIGEIRDGKLNMFDGKYMENGRIVIKKGDKKYNTKGQLLKL